MSDLTPDRQHETLETLRLTDAEFGGLTPSGRRIIAEHGFAGLRLRSQVAREVASLERNQYFMHLYAAKNAEREMGIESPIVDVEGEETVHLADQVDALAGEITALREENRRLKVEQTRLRDKLASTAVAVDADK